MPDRDNIVSDQSMNFTDWCKGFVSSEVINKVNTVTRSKKKTEEIIISITNNLTNKFYERIWKDRCKKQNDFEMEVGIIKKDKRKKRINVNK